MKNCLIFGSVSMFESNKELICRQYNVIGFLDNDVSKHGITADGKIIISPNKASDYEYDEILIMSRNHFVDMLHQLIDIQVPGHKINYEFLRAILNTNKQISMNKEPIKTENKDFYTKQFYESQRSYSRSSAEIVVPIIMQCLRLIEPESVLDLGCGSGAWLSVFKDNGIKKIKGVDGDYVNKSVLYIDTKEFYPHDLRTPLNLSELFDLAVSIEVAEHLPAECAEIFVSSLCSHSDVVLFGAAIPGQPGDNHINCRYPTYWSELFRKNQYVCFDVLRPKIWRNRGIAAQYKQNMMFYIKDGSRSMDNFIKANIDALYGEPLDVIHQDTLSGRFFP